MCLLFYSTTRGIDEDDVIDNMYTYIDYRR